MSATALLPRRARSVAAVAALLAGALAISGCTSSTGGTADNPVVSVPVTTSTPSSPSSSIATVAGSGTCSYPAAGAAAKDVGTPPTSTLLAPKTLTLHLTVGTANKAEDVVITLAPQTAPCTVNSIAFLAGKKYFDSTICHRLTTSGIHVLQCGDPTGTGSGGPGYSFADELSGSETYPAGTVAMANAGTNTNGSQFFLVYGDTPLPANYTVFGKITTGLDVISQVAAAGSDDSNGAGDGKPKTSVTITSTSTG
ncbi:MAG: peptidylprolyl isomerase [Jatrophihabitantaceae bacterium]